MLGCTAASEAAASPPNDRFRDARPLDPSSPFRLATTRGATRQRDEPLHAGQGGPAGSIWFRLRAGAARDLAIRACPIAGWRGPVAIGVYRGRRLANLTEVGAAALFSTGLGCQGRGAVFRTAAARSYRIAVQTPRPGADGIVVSLGDVAPPPGVAVGGVSSPARTVPLRRSFAIARRPGGKPRPVASIPLAGLGALEPGAALHGSGELQVSVCAKPPGGGRRGDCFGRQYGYNPLVRARLLLSRSPVAAAGAESRPLGRARTLRCRGRQPNRNHHCALALRWKRLKLGAAGRAMPRCAPHDCWLVLVASASHRRAARGQRVVVGGVRADGIKRRGSTRLAALRVGPDPHSGETLADRKPHSRRLPLAPAGRGIKLRSLYSVRVPAPRAGEALRIEGAAVTRLGRIPYNARTRTRLVLADRPLAVNPGPRARRLVVGSPRLGTTTYFNCTRGPSAHRSPCVSRKPGLVRFRVSSERPVYVNLLAGHGAIGERADRRRARDRVRVGAGGLKIRRLRP